MAPRPIRNFANSQQRYQPCKKYCSAALIWCNRYESSKIFLITKQDLVKTQNYSGFTLIELLIGLVIVAILAAVAFPSYSRYVYRAHRTDATSALITIQMQQEKYRSDNVSYGTMAQLGYAADPSVTVYGYYNVTITSPTGAAFTAMATPIGSQTGDTTCPNLTVTVTNGTATTTPSSCWAK